MKRNLFFKFRNAIGEFFFLSRIELLKIRDALVVLLLEHIEFLPETRNYVIRQLQFVSVLDSLKGRCKCGEAKRSGKCPHMDEFHSFRTPNEAVEKLLKNILTAKWVGGETLPDTAIVDPGAFCEANFLRHVFEIFSFGFFYSLNVKLRGCALLRSPA